MRRAAVFLDRDGVINRECGFVRNPGELEVVDGAAAALAELGRLGYLRLVVTNQSCIARGVCSWDDLHAVHRRLRAEVGGAIDGIYVCPHHPTEGTTSMTRRCPCRKPGTALLAQARREHDLDPAACWLVGDAPHDVEAARAAGVRALAVLGPRIASPAAYPGAAAAPEAFVADLPDAVRRIRSGG